MSYGEKKFNRNMLLRHLEASQPLIQKHLVESGEYFLPSHGRDVAFLKCIVDSDLFEKSLTELFATPA